MLVATALTLLLAPLSQNVIVVDDDGGADHTNAQVAIDDAVDGDTILVRSGTYGVISIVDKSLTIVADTSPGATPPTFTRARVTNLAANRRASLIGLTVVSVSADPLQVAFAPALEVIDCAGTVLLQSCLADGPDQGPFAATGGAIRIERSDAVFVVDCLGRSRNTANADGPDGLSIVDSTVHVFGGGFEGAQGRPGPQFVAAPTTGEPGGAGIGAVDSELFLSGTALRGGSGGLGGVVDFRPGAGCSNGGQGGPGLQTVDSLVSYRDLTLIGGPGGSPFPTSTCLPGPSGVPLEVLGGLAVDVAGDAPTLSVSPNPAREGEALTAVFEGDPGSVVVWVASVQATAPATLDLGGPVLPGTADLVLLPGVVGVDGRLEVSITLGSFAPGIEGVSLFEQAFHVTPSGMAFASSPQQVVHLDAAF